MPAFEYANPPVIHWGAGSVEQLGRELEHHQISSVLVVTTRSLVDASRRLPLRPAAARGMAVIGQHAPMAEIEVAVTEADGAGVDGVVSFGGGSPIDAAKIIAMRLGSDQRAVPHVAVPTTLSVAELASGAGYTDTSGTKAGLRDARLMPRAVIYDAQLALDTPMELWLSTGIRALDHAVEGFLADGDHPFNDVMALEAVRRLFKSLPEAKADPKDTGVRTENQLAAWFSFTLPSASAAGLSHMMGKQIGARHRIPHGVTSCLLMPHVMRYLATIKPERMKMIGDDAPGDVGRLIASLALPQHIAAYGVDEAQLRAAAHELAGKFPETDLLQIYLAAL